MFLSPGANAQSPPTGDHHAARPSGTGHGGAAVNSGGSHVFTISLELAATRERLPIPINVVHGHQSVGAVGLTWDLSVSFVPHERTLVHHCPELAVDAFPSARERMNACSDHKE